LVRETQVLRGMIDKSVSAPNKTNHMLILNLAAADFFIGVYIFMLAIADAVFSGNFCANYLNWKSSLTCTMMGIFTIIGSEVSVLTLALLTSFRVYAVFWVSFEYLK